MVRTRDRTNQCRTTDVVNFIRKITREWNDQVQRAINRLIKLARDQRPAMKKISRKTKENMDGK